MIGTGIICGLLCKRETYVGGGETPTLIRVAKMKSSNQSVHRLEYFCAVTLDIGHKPVQQTQVPMSESSRITDA